jgi:tRNA 2-thiouridine synthesizing protein A
MIEGIGGHDDSQTMMAKTLNLRGLKSPLPALRTRKATGAMQAGDVLTLECTDPLASVDIPNLLSQTADILEAHVAAGKARKVYRKRVRASKRRLLRRSRRS